MTSTVDKPKKHISAISAEYRPFWQPLFENMGLSNPIFGAKLCYLGKEFTTPDGKREPCIRFFPNELNMSGDYYTELFDWDQNRYEATSRALYRLPQNPNWQKEPHKYVEVPSDKLPTSTYAVRLSDLELVNRTDAKALYPDMVKGTAPVAEKSLFSAVADKAEPQADVLDELALTEMFSDKEDNHYSSMTIRDLYCMLQNVPLSNKKWLNKLIQEGKQCQK